jgi:hypothetical protein
MNGPTEVISEDRMRTLVDTGAAQPLLPGFFPAPVRVDGVWWYSPLDAADHHYVRASKDDARHYDEMADRHRVAHPAPREGSG